MVENWASKSWNLFALGLLTRRWLSVKFLSFPLVSALSFFFFWLLRFWIFPSESRKSAATSQSCVQNVQLDLIMLSLPAIAGQAIEPMAQLMETAYIGRLGKSIFTPNFFTFNLFRRLFKFHFFFPCFCFSMLFSYWIFLFGSSKLIGNFEVVVSSFRLRILWCMWL